MKNLLNFIKNRTVRQIALLFILFFVYIFICSLSYATAVSNDIINNVFRLHVIANSDSKEDQDLKYIVRDDLLKYMNELCQNCQTKEEAINIVESNLSSFQSIAKKTVQEHGYNYDVKLSVGNFEFPTKTYGDIHFPTGYYDALKVEIGEADGQNWWCVMFPSLCFIDISAGVVDNEGKDLLKNNLSEESYTVVSDTDNMGVKIKFKLLELFASKN